MKTESQVRQQLKQVIFRHRKKRLDAMFKKHPDTCRHNSTMEATAADDALGVQACFYTTDGVPRGVLCDVRYDNGARARGCPLWEPRGDKEKIKAEFEGVLESGNRGLIAKNFPDVAALLWVLDGPFTGEDTEEEPTTETSEPAKRWDWDRWPWSKR